jgi:VanZ family protein
MNFVRFLKYWMPIFVWLGVIFVGSTDLMSAEQTSRFLVPFLRWLKPDISPETIAQIHFLFRKLGHISEYAILAMLFWRAVYRGTNLEMKMSPDPAKACSSFDTKTVAGQTVQTEGAGRPSLVDSTGCPWVRSRSILRLRSGQALAVSVWVVATLVAATDEYHQSFVLSRTASVIDVLIDSGGAILGLLVISRWRRPRDR